MKNIIKLLCLAITSLYFIGCADTPTNQGGGTSTIKMPTAQQVQTALYTVGNIIQQLNTGFQVAAPSVAQILTMTHNQGDAEVLAEATPKAAVVNAAVQSLVTMVNTAIEASKAHNATPEQQQEAVNAAVSPTSVNAIVSTVQATENP